MKHTNEWPDYDPRELEPRIQQGWDREGIYRTGEDGEKEKFYCLDFFPYPSGEGLHVGHCRNYVPTDVISRYKRMAGFNVLHPMGWDAFGEPAEQHAARFGDHPRITTDRNTANYRRQMKLIGASYDWSREIDSSKPEFYRWTQYFFLLLHKRGLAYRDTNWQWWCDGCQTTLSSHEVAGGVCWRGHTTIYKREIPAWYFRITAYAERLLSGLDEIDWPEPIKIMQRNWIGRSEGCEIHFKLENGASVPVFTTRPDTLFGVTFFVLAPEHPLVPVLTVPGQASEVEAYAAQAARQSEIDRLSEANEKTGVFTGGYVLNPLSGERVPVWIADYVLPGYGTGAVMGVPAHDPRDYAIARRYDLPIRVAITPDESTQQDGVSVTEAYTGEGLLVNSGVYDGLSSAAARQRIGKDLAASSLGGPSVTYRMRDWLISRQRYWGTPIPIVHCDRCGIVPVPEDQLPVLLPPMVNFAPDGSGRSPLGRLPEFVNTSCPQCGGPAQRETDTMGGFACSSWYFLRFTSPHYADGPFDPEAMRYWMPTDLYVGGAEHAVLHLLYARFWVKVMADAGLVPFDEPFTKLVNQGQLLGPDGKRMSKSRGNVITPDEIVESHGADALRIYEMFMAPFDQDIAWSQVGIVGARRFLNRVWSLATEWYAGGEKGGRVNANSVSAGHENAGSDFAESEDLELLRLTHKTIRRVAERIETFRFNTMISFLMEFVNFLVERQQAGAWRNATFHEALDTLMLLLAPTAPYIADELWSRTGHDGSIHQQAWPRWEAELVQDELVQLAVQVDGRLRDLLELEIDAAEEDVKQAAMNKARVQQALAGRRLDRIVYIPGKILNIVTNKSEEEKESR